MSENYETTIIIRRPARIETDDRGRAVWSEPIEDTELELMSTQALEAALSAANDQGKASIRAIAESDNEGVVVRDGATGLFGVISETELQELLDKDANKAMARSGADPMTESADSPEGAELSLASTQALRKVLRRTQAEKSEDIGEDSGGFDPYNRN